MEQKSRTWAIADVNREDLQAAADETVNLVLRKNSDYGDAWQKQGLAGVLVRLSDKSLRVERLFGGVQALVADEKVEDTLRDLAGYALLGLLYVQSLDKARVGSEV